MEPLSLGTEVTFLDGHRQERAGRVVSVVFQDEYPDDPAVTEWLPPGLDLPSSIRRVRIHAMLPRKKIRYLVESGGRLYFPYPDNLKTT